MDISRFIETVKKWDVEYTENYEIKKHSFIGIGPVARLAIFPKSCSDFASSILYLYMNKLNFKVTGKLTNLLFRGNKFDGVIVNTSKLNSYFEAETSVDIECGAGLSRIIYEMSKKGLGGLEALYGIPGSLGGMVYSNAGAYGKSISDFLEYALVLDLNTKSIRRFYNDELDFSYRHSALSRGDLYVLYARMNFQRGDSEEIKRALAKSLEKRKNSQPYSEKTLGSTFKRAGDVPVSKLIDECGLKGTAVGDAVVSQKHAGFIINRGNATSEDVIELMEKVRRELFSRFGIFPDPEIEII